jgi:heme-degrading monooxygenase HmoA
MEHTQMVLFQVPAEKAAEIARYEGLLAEMEGHKARLQLMPGFLDMVFTRSLNDTGPVQLVVLTRWRDPDSLGDYEESKPTVPDVLDCFKELVVPGSIQIYDMEVII